MASAIPGLIISLKSSGGPTGDQYKGVYATSSADQDGYAILDDRGHRFTGVLLGNSTEATFQEVQVSGVAKMAAGDSSAMETAITVGLTLSLSTIGQAVPSTGGAGEWKIGTALDSLTTGSTGIIRVLLGAFQSSS
jgi:hypothetical protein